MRAKIGIGVRSGQVEKAAFLGVSAVVALASLVVGCGDSVDTAAEPLESMAERLVQVDAKLAKDPMGCVEFDAICKSAAPRCNAGEAPDACASMADRCTSELADACTELAATTGGSGQEPGDGVRSPQGLSAIFAIIVGAAAGAAGAVYWMDQWKNRNNAPDCCDEYPNPKRQTIFQRWICVKNCDDGWKLALGGRRCRKGVFRWKDVESVPADQCQQ